MQVDMPGYLDSDTIKLKVKTHTAGSYARYQEEVPCHQQILVYHVGLEIDYGMLIAVDVSIGDENRVANMPTYG